MSPSTTLQTNEPAQGQYMGQEQLMDMMTPHKIFSISAKYIHNKGFVGHLVYCDG